MSGISNSSIQPWLDLNNAASNLPTNIPVCQGPQKCAEVCIESVELIDPGRPNNLLTCGLFSSLTMLNYYAVQMPSVAPLPKSRVDTLLEPFSRLGLDANNETHSYATRNAVSECLSELYQVTRVQTSKGQEVSTGPCSEQLLYPFQASEFSTNIAEPLLSCVNAICAPRTLNSDLGGVGIFISLLLQLSFAIAFFLGLLALELCPSESEKVTRTHTDILAAAVVDFHKTQCYFIFALEIAAIVLNRQSYSDFAADRPPPIFDMLLSLPLSLNGIVPIALTLCCIARYARLSWHIIGISFVVFALSTGALGAATKWILTASDAFGPDMLSVNNAGFDWYDGIALARQVCGSNTGNISSVIDRTSIKFSLIWVIFSYCILCSVWCLMKLVIQLAPGGSRRERFLRAGGPLMSESALGQPGKIMLRGFYALLAVLWILCLAYHFYLYSLFTRYHLVSTQWSFGQIIAVTVWFPSVVELAYMEYLGISIASRYKYPPGLQVLKADDHAETHRVEGESVPLTETGRLHD